MLKGDNLKIIEGDSRELSCMLRKNAALRSIKMEGIVMKKIRTALMILQSFVGIGAIAGGLAAIVNPNNPMGITLDTLVNSPFSNFLIPGIILFAIIGIGSIASAIALALDFRFQGFVSSVFSWALVIWIVVQCIMLNEIIPLHIIFFSIGLVEAALSAIILFKQRMFPANFVLSFLEKQQAQ